MRESEIQYWQDLSIDFMSEESDDPSDCNNLIIHRLPWLSESKSSCRPCNYISVRT